jgi:hypothetical protein
MRIVGERVFGSEFEVGTRGAPGAEPRVETQIVVVEMRGGGTRLRVHRRRATRRAVRALADLKIMAASWREMNKLWLNDGVFRRALLM